MEQTKWEVIKNFINSNKKFTRKELKSSMKYFGNTEDQYILILTHVGFIKKIKTATYIKNVNIPENLSISKLNKFAYNIKFYDESKRLISTLSRKEKLHEIKKSSIS